VSDTISWYWIAVALVLPLMLATALAWPFWGRSRDSLGSIVGAFVIFLFVMALVGREYIHIQRLTVQCIATERICRFHPDPFTRFCLYGFIAMIQASVLFGMGRWREDRLENQAFDKEWRR
jgi:formate hydrogenlyase subunit 3/multisubunit Na+/H+ antiporter MnhD subunit